MSAQVLAGYLDGDGLRAVVKTLAQRPGAFFILESVDNLSMGCIEENDEAFVEDNDPVAQEEGRLFDHDFELRWQHLRGYPPYPLPFRVRLISDKADLFEMVVKGATDLNWQSTTSDKAMPLQLTPISPDEPYYLWGERVAGNPQPPIWYEKQTPRMFAYPVKVWAADRRVKLIIINYHYRIANTDKDILLQRFSAFITE